MSRKSCYSDLSHPGMQEKLTQHNVSTLKLALLVAEFAQQMAAAHEMFSKEIQTVISNIKRKNHDLKKERPVETASTIHCAWEALLLEVEMDAQAHLDVASLLLKNVYKPLDEVATHKTSQAKKLQGFRQSFEMLVSNTEDKLEKCLKGYHESYQVFKMSNGSSMPGTREAAKISFYNAHNDYLLQLRSSNRLIEQFHLVLPQVLEELEEIHIDTSNTINVAIESHALLLLTKATEQHRRFESLLKVCRQVNPQLDISSFVKAVSPEPLRLELSIHQFSPPPDLNLNNPEEALRNRLVLDRHTEVAIKERRSAIQREAAELTSYIKQNQDVTQTLVNICQRNLANHLYEKVYETQEDLCRKRNEIRLANMQLAAVRAQVDMLTPKQNGTVEGVDQDSKKASSASIKGMWKKAFKTLKSTEEKSEKDKEKEKDKGKGSGSLIKRSSFTKLRKDSKEKDDVTEGEQEVSHEIDPVYSLLKCAADLPKAGSSGKPCTNTTCSGHKHGIECGGNTSQSSSPSSSASDTPRNWRKKLNARMKSFSLDTPDSPKQLLGIDETTKKKSHSFTNTCVPASHSPKTRRKKLNARMKSFSLDTQEPPKQLLAIDETTKKKSSSFTNTCLGGID
ncbi:uncharacterized protein LOC135466306 isoform X1 [Liolophura sinensis]|uniref:uncharacterized protein LOC135466306 isoform X1 n=1 Tax=Liolophura sinensis TaxID=3198878 RepID=UPI003158546B